MTKRKRAKSIKERLNIATKKGRDEGFKEGQKYANKLRDNLINAEQAEMRRQLLKEVSLERFKTVTQLLTGLSSMVFQATRELGAVDGRID